MSEPIKTAINARGLPSGLTPSVQASSSLVPAPKRLNTNHVPNDLSAGIEIPSGPMLNTAGWDALSAEIDNVEPMGAASFVNLSRSGLVKVDKVKLPRQPTGASHDC
jgi:hypothetical protein